MKTYTQDQLKEIIAKHQLWLYDEEGGERADLRSADLRYADLSYADLSYADLRNGELSSADLRCADLRCADLSNADLSYANLSNADLRCADLRYANLILIGQDIRGHLFYGWRNEEDVVVIRAGCRQLVGIAAARAHWAERHINDVVLHGDCLSLVERAERMAKVRGWKLEPTPAA
ncbi:MAG: pentapeptide repeat-containing protein [Desulfurellales bacterium]|nr:MAG: pentapeptide repeat-containing protein [Desulfurellales bacterium]